MIRLSRFLKSRPLWLLLGFVLLIVIARRAGLNEQLLFDSLRENRAWLLQQVAAHPVLTALAYVAVYCAVVAMALPFAVLLTVSGGFLFGAFLGTGLTVVGATAGAALVFLLAQRVLGEQVLDRFGATAQRLASAIRRDAALYLLAIRFVPLFPFVMVNLASAFVGVPLLTFVLTTFVGIIPGTLVFSLAGAGLGRVLDSGQALSAKTILTPEIIGGMAGLAALSLAAIPIRRWLDAQDRIKPS